MVISPDKSDCAQRFAYASDNHKSCVNLLAEQSGKIIF